MRAPVLVVGVVMAVSGFSRDTFMGLLLLAAGVGLVAPNIKNVQSPPPGTGRGGRATKADAIRYVAETALAPAPAAVRPLTGRLRPVVSRQAKATSTAVAVAAAREPKRRVRMVPPKD